MGKLTLMAAEELQDPIHPSLDNSAGSKARCKL